MGQTKTLKDKVVDGAAWTFMEKLSTYVVGFVVSMVLARLLTPNDYGTVALTAIFFSVANVLVDGGFGGALIQKKDADDLDFNSVFYLNLFLSILAYAVLYCIAPNISNFYRSPELTNLVRVSSLCFLFNSINSIQNAELTKKMLFHLSFRISMITSVTSAICGISMAIMGWGAWALVVSTLVSGAVGAISRWFIIAWRPKPIFSFVRLKPLFSFGWKMTLSALFDRIFENLNGLLIGRFYSRVDLAYVNKGTSLPSLSMNLIDETLGRVSFPAMVELQSKREKLRDAMRKLIVCSTFFVFPAMGMIAIAAQDIVLLLYGKQWRPSVPYMIMACFSFALWPFHTINLRAIMALGRSDVFLNLEIIKKVAKICVILSCLPFGVFMFMAGCAFALGPLSVLINAWPNKKLLGYTLKMQIMDILPNASICIVAMSFSWLFVFLLAMCFPAFCAEDSTLIVLKIILQCFFFVLAYVGLSVLYRVKALAGYAHVLAGLICSRCPRVALILERRFSK